MVIHMMVNSCSAFGCTNRFSRDCNIRFFRFPKDPFRKKLWILALRRKNFEPSKSARICSEHFQTGRPSKESNHPDYVPSIFTFDPPKKTRKNNRKLTKAAFIFSNNSKTSMDVKLESYDSSKSDGKPSKDSSHPYHVPNIITFDTSSKTRKNNIKQKTAACIHSNDSESNMDVKLVSGDTSENDGSTGIKDQTLKCRTKLPRFLKSNNGKLEKGSEEELLSLKLELHEAFTDISTLKKENAILRKQLSTAEATMSIFHKAISEKEEELVKVKKELQQAYIEVSALRMEKAELQKKLLSADITQGILQDPNKLHFYTGMNSLKDFNSILSLLSNIESHVRSVPLETQVLIVLTKLKLNLLHTDLAYRFQTSSKTVHRICNIIIPPLETKINLLVKCPINTALKRNIPVCFKNTMYENLYQRLIRYSKLKTKQFEEEEEDTEFGIL